MSIEKEFIPYEQALALKELGFDEPCCANMFDYSKSHINTDVPNRIRFYNVEFSKDFNKQYEPVHLISTDIFVSIPLYQQAFRWFREKYRCEFHIDCRRHTSVKYYEVFLFDGNKSSMVFGKSLTYKEAELECLKKLIELIK